MQPQRLALLIFALSAFTNPLVAQTLKGSRESVARQYQLAVSYDYSFLQTPSAVRNFIQEGYLVEVKPGRTVELAAVSYPYARPEVKLFVERFSEQYVQACGEKLTVTSLTRPINLQPANASETSVHPTGMAVDLRVPRDGKCRSWLESTLLSLEGTGVLDVTREYYPPHFHVAIYTKIYGNYVATLDKTSPGAAVAAGGLTDYVVRRGDTLSKIATNNGTSIAALRSANGLRNDLLNVGQKLQIPGQAAAPAVQQVAAAPIQAEESSAALPVQAVAAVAVRNAATVQRGNGSYTVKRGDTLARIAENTGTSIAALRRSNGLRGSLIHPGQTLQVPGQVAVEPAVARVAQQDVIPASASSYTVRKGDSLAKIAELANTTVNDLRKVNGIRSSVIQPGQTLQLPGREVEAGIAAQVAQVEQTAQVEQVAQAAPATAPDYVAASTVASTTPVGPSAALMPAMAVPAASLVAETVETVEATEAAASAVTSYSVRKGDTLARIAERTGTDVTSLRRANGLRSDLLQVGQTLSVPTLASAGQSAEEATVEVEHKVRRGESLWNIANRYGTDVSSLRRANDLTGDALTIGQVLRVTVALRAN
jgi:LysM repeat protein